MANVTAKDAPYGMPDDEVIAALADHGNVVEAVGLYVVALNTSLFCTSCIALMPAIEKYLASAL